MESSPKEENRTPSSRWRYPPLPEPRSLMPPRHMDLFRDSGNLAIPFHTLQALLLWHCSAGTAPGQGRSGPMEALLFCFVLCHCSWQKSAQSGRRLFLSASSLGPKTGRNWERKKRKKEHNSTILVSFPRHKAGNPSTTDTPGLAPPLLHRGHFRRSHFHAVVHRHRAAESWPCAARAQRCVYTSFTLSILSLCGYIQPCCVCSEMENASAEAKRAPCLLAGTPAPFLPLRRTCRRLPCFEGKGSFLLLWKKEQLCSKVRHQHSRGECSGSQRSDSHSLRPLVIPSWEVCKICTLKGGAILDEDGKLGGVWKIHRNWAVLDPFPPPAASEVVSFRRSPNSEDKQ